MRAVRRVQCTALLALVLSAGCAGSGPPPTTSTGQFDDLQRNIFDVHCLSAGCHNSQSQAGGLNLTAGVSYDQLVDVAPTNPAALSAGLLRVEPFQPNDSFLLVKVTAPASGEGSQMPFGMDALSPTDVAAIRAWIVAGAPRGSNPSPSPSAVPSSTATVTSTPAATNTATATVTGSAPPTSTGTATPSPSPSPTATPTQSLFGQIQTTIFSTTCVDSFCHDASGMSGGLVLTEGQSYGNLVNVSPQNAVALAEGLLRVAPGDPDHSFLVVKLAGPPLVSLGSQMPLGKDPLSEAQMQLIRDWISAGANP